MAYIYQLNDARNSVALRNVAAVKVESEQFTALINEAQRRLARRGEWYGLTQTAKFMFQGQTVTWPRYVGTVIAARTCQGQEVEPRNRWFSFTGAFPGPSAQFGANLTLEDAGQRCTLNDITGEGEGQYIRLYIEKAADVGKKVKIYGRAYGNQPLMEKVDGVWQAGITLTTTTAPYVQTAVKIIQIDSIIKDQMEGLSRLYEYDTTSATMRLIALFEPNETNPTYRSSIVRGAACENCGTDPRYNVLNVLVKLAFVPATAATDFLMIDNFDALKMGIQAIKAEEAGDNNSAEAFWIKAIRELNFDERDKVPDSMTSVYLDATMCGRLENPN